VRFRRDFISGRLGVGVVAAMLVIVLSFAGLSSVRAQNITVSTPRDCDSNAVVFCGASSVNQLINKFHGGDGRNSASSIQNIFSWFGVSAADVDSLNNAGVHVVAGSVGRSGNVRDGAGHLVAAGAITGGRQDIAGSSRASRGSTVFFVRPPSVSFVSNSLPAFVVMKGGQFQFAIIASCGNVVKAHPRAAPAPAPAPKPSFKINKTVSANGSGFQKSVTVRAGSTVTPRCYAARIDLRCRLADP
jgi:hypothetical protein